MMTLLTTPGIKLMEAARLDRRQRGGEGCEKKRREKEKISGRKRQLWRVRERTREGERVTRGARGESKGAFKIWLVEEAVRAVR